MRILKFGGSSLADVERIERVARIVLSASEQGPLAVVVSALGGVTDRLLDACADPGNGDAIVAELAERHARLIESLAQQDERVELSRRLDSALAEVRDLLHGMALLGECTPRTRDRFLSYGERLSALVVAAALRAVGLDAEECDARELVRTDETHGHALVDQATTARLIRERFAAAERLQVVTGFIGRSASGETTTLGRSGSDYTAALLGAALDAELVEIWTDVDGVMSCDPRHVPDAFSLPRLSYEELMELSHFGAEVVFPPAVHPARTRGIALLIRNTLHPEFPGTRVDAGPPDDEERAPRPITGIASIHHVALLRLEGEGMLGVPGTARRLFDALARRSINVILISQASSEHSICLAIDPDDAETARAEVEEEFALEIGAGMIEPLVVEDDQCVVAVVGEGMRERPGLAARLFRVLGQRGINVRAIAQGSSERNLSLVLARRDETRALRAVHESFFRPDDRTLKVVQLGVGGVGSALLGQLAARLGELLASGVELRLCGLASSRHMALEAGGLDLPHDESPRTWLEQQGEPYCLERIVSFLEELDGPRVLVDCTATPDAGELYRQLLERRVSVVAANKVAFAGSLAQDPRQRGPYDGYGVYYETTVGAGLPVLRAVQDLVRTGDRLRRIEGLFSGTLTYLASRLLEGEAFSTAVEAAHRLGYTEPDPRVDLGGLDVARKLVILAREAGAALELGAVEVEPLIEASWLELPLDEFWRRLPELDEPFARRAERCRTQRLGLAYLARLELDDPEAPRASVSLVELEPSHPCAAARGTDNSFALYTDRYDPSPLVLQGPGAGTAVTAGGVFVDMLRAHAESVRDPLVPIPPSVRE